MKTPNTRNAKQINERISPTAKLQSITPKAYGFKLVNGELPPWRLQARPIPTPEESHVAVTTVRKSQSSIGAETWSDHLLRQTPLALGANSSHVLELQADVHSTAYLRWAFKAQQNTSLKLKVTYSEGYEHEPRSYPFFRSKADRLDAENGHLIGPYDEVTLELQAGEVRVYEPFWFRTFRILRLEFTVGSMPIEFSSFTATQVNYPLAVKAKWSEPGSMYSEKTWDVSIRTMRNCMFDGYSDCPFYEQLQWVQSAVSNSSDD